jgi:hypothetical protein
MLNACVVKPSFPCSESLIEHSCFQDKSVNACVVNPSFQCSESLIEHSCFQDKSVSGFISYALCATDEALRDANWLPSEDEKKERTVSFPSVQALFFHICISEFLGSGWICIRVSRLAEGLEASQTF